MSTAECCNDEISITVDDQQVIVIEIEQGPPGPPGPAGPSGSAGPYVVKTVSSLIPLGQLYTFVNSTLATIQTLPPISSVLVGNVTVAYVINRVGTGAVTAIGSGSDQVQYGSSLIIPRQKDSITLLPTTEFGWVLI